MEFARGDAVALNGERLSAAALLARLNEIGGAYQQAAAAGFIRLNAQRLRLAAKQGRKLTERGYNISPVQHGA